MTILVPADPSDLLEVRFAWSPIWETLAAARTFIDPRTRPFHETWHASVADAASRLDLAPLHAVSPLRGYTPDFLTPPPRVPAPRFADQVREIRRTPLDQVARELRRCARELNDPDARRAVTGMLEDTRSARRLLADRTQSVWERLVEPFWPRVRDLLDADIAHRSRILARYGFGRMLAGLDGRIKLRHGSVVVQDGSGESVELEGRAIVLMPSAYIWPNVVAIVDKPWQPTVVYPARGIADLWRYPSPPPTALVRLIGKTRAHLLAGLDRPTSTSALAGIFGLSPSGISGHLIALRDAGLIAGARHGHEVRYARTALGARLLRSPEQPPVR